MKNRRTFFLMALLPIIGLTAVFCGAQSPDQGGEAQQKKKPQLVNISASKTPLVPLTPRFKAKYRITGGTLRIGGKTRKVSNERSSTFEVAVQASFKFDGATIYFLKTSSPDFEVVSFVTNLEDGYWETAECYPRLSEPSSLHFKYPAEASDPSWTYIEVEESNDISVQMSVTATNTTHVVEGVTYKGCIDYKEVYSGQQVAIYRFKPGVGMIEYIYSADGQELSHWSKIP